MSRAFSIKDFPEYYVTDTCDVYSRNINHNPMCRIRKLTTHINRGGYLIVKLRKNHILYNKQLHRLVAETFIPNPENKPFVNHKNGIKTDNRIENLEWVTRAENEQHKYHVLGYHGTWHKKENEVPWAKPVLQIKDGKVIKEYCSAMEAQRQTGINRTNINACCYGRYGYKHAGGFEWRLKK